MFIYRKRSEIGGSAVWRHSSMPVLLGSIPLADIQTPMVRTMLAPCTVHAEMVHGAWFVGTLELKCFLTVFYYKRPYAGLHTCGAYTGCSVYIGISLWCLLSLASSFILKKISGPTQNPCLFAHERQLGRASKQIILCVVAIVRSAFEAPYTLILMFHINPFVDKAAC